MATPSLPPKPQSEIWEYCSMCKSSKPRGHVCVLRSPWTRTWTGIRNFFANSIYLCQRCGNWVGDNHLCTYQVGWRLNFASGALAVAGIVGIVYLPLIMRSPLPVVGSGPTTPTPTPIIIGPPWVDTPTVEPVPTPPAVQR